MRRATVSLFALAAVIALVPGPGGGRLFPTIQAAVDRARRGDTI